MSSLLSDLFLVEVKLGFRKCTTIRAAVGSIQQDSHTGSNFKGSLHWISGFALAGHSILKAWFFWRRKEHSKQWEETYCILSIHSWQYSKQNCAPGRFKVLCQSAISWCFWSCTQRKWLNNFACTRLSNSSGIQHHFYRVSQTWLIEKAEKARTATDHSRLKLKLELFTESWPSRANRCFG